MRRALRPSIVALVGGALLLTPIGAGAQPISTATALALEQRAENEAVVDAYFAREEVEAQLAALGVDPELAKLRAAALSPSELAELAGRIEEAPAGGDLIAVLGVTFVVLLVLELVGVIDIFKKL
jgi:hypothetical protein